LLEDCNSQLTHRKQEIEKLQTQLADEASQTANLLRALNEKKSTQENQERASAELEVSLHKANEEVRDLLQQKNALDIQLVACKKEQVSNASGLVQYQF
jgi:septal ring factor EnvC (AmiA/AmiB activator)